MIRTFFIGLLCVVLASPALAALKQNDIHSSQIITIRDAQTNLCVVARNIGHMTLEQPLLADCSALDLGHHLLR